MYALVYSLHMFDMYHMCTKNVFYFKLPMVKPVCKGLKRGLFFRIKLYYDEEPYIISACDIDVSIGDRFHCMCYFIRQVSLNVNIDTGII